MSDAPEVTRLVAGLAPPVGYLGAKVAGLTPDQWVTVLTLVWLLLGILSQLFPGWRSTLASIVAALLDAVFPVWRRWLPRRWRDG